MHRFLKVLYSCYSDRLLWSGRLYECSEVTRGSPASKFIYSVLEESFQNLCRVNKELEDLYLKQFGKFTCLLQRSGAVRMEMIVMVHAVFHWIGHNLLDLLRPIILFLIHWIVRTFLYCEVHRYLDFLCNENNTGVLSQQWLCLLATCQILPMKVSEPPFAFQL